MRIVIVMVAFLIYTFLFYKAAGTLSLKKLNLISIAYYFGLVFCVIGASLIFCGFRNNYAITRLEDKVAVKTYIILMWALIAFPLTTWICNSLIFRINMKKEYNTMLEKDVIIERNTNFVCFLVSALGVICIFSIIYVFKCIGFFPLIKLLTSDATELAVTRIQVTKNFSGNTYVRNIIMSALTPILSYISYVYMRATNQDKWKALFIILFICSVLSKTYNFEKAPIVWYLFYFYIIEILMGNIKSIKNLLWIGATGTAIMLFFYYVILDYTGKLFTISGGLGGRIFMTQITTLFSHVEIFPDICPYLEGASLPRIYAMLLSLNSSGIRSGRVVMELVHPEAVKAGTAGVMNSVFIAEAYANWGWVGVIIAPIYVGVLYSSFSCFFVKQKKTPLLIIAYLIIVLNFSQIFIGGFVDYLYPILVVLMLMVVLGISILKNRGKIRFTVRR